jgi:hypothetical protein
MKDPRTLHDDGLRRKLGRERFKPVFVMETAENRFRSNPMSLRNAVGG